MRIKSEGLYRIWVSNGSTAAGNYKDSDLVAVKTKEMADRLLAALKTGWEAVITTAAHSVIVKHIQPAAGSTGADSTLTPHQISQQREARKLIGQTLNVDEDVAYMVFRLYAELGNSVILDNRKSGIATIPLIVQETAPVPTPAGSGEPAQETAPA